MLRASLVENESFCHGASQQTRALVEIKHLSEASAMVVMATGPGRGHLKFKIQLSVYKMTMTVMVSILGWF